MTTARRYLASRFTHNTAEPHNLRAEDYLVACDRQRLDAEGAPGFAATARLEGQQFTHRRTVRLPAQGSEALRVTDEMRGPRGYLLKWHVGTALRLKPIASAARMAQFTSVEHGIVVEIRADHEVVCAWAPQARAIPGVAIGALGRQSSVPGPPGPAAPRGRGMLPGGDRGAQNHWPGTARVPWHAPGVTAETGVVRGIGSTAARLSALGRPAADRRCRVRACAVRRLRAALGLAATPPPAGVGVIMPGEWLRIAER